jgi:hypothetical protein
MGRAVWAVALTAAAARTEHRRWAGSLIDRILPHLARVSSPRAEAFITLGLAAMLEAGWRDERIGALVQAKAERLACLVETGQALGRPWFEAALAYDNARLPEALIHAGRVLKTDRFTALGLKSLTWLAQRQTDPLGAFLPVATADFGRPLNASGLFDQQPVEAAAMIDACAAAHAASGDSRWLSEAERAFAWYFGANTLGVTLATETGGCYDGLTWNGPNENQGAESILSLQLAACAMERLTVSGRPRVKTAGD